MPRNSWPTKLIAKETNRLLFLFLVLIVIISGSAPDGVAQRVTNTPDELKKVTVDEHLGNKIPTDLAFTDDHENVVALGDYLNQDKPVILILGYYTCPMLCNLVFNGVRDAINGMPLELGKDFTIVNVSIDSSDTPVIAAAKKKNYMSSLKKEAPESGWMFLTGGGEKARTLAKAVGFEYYYDTKTKQYAHPALITILSPDGTISRYMYGIQFNPRDLRLALLEASQGKIGNTVDRILLYCYHYDPQTGGYSLFAERLMRVGGLITMVILGVFVGFLFFRGKHKKNREQISLN